MALDTTYRQVQSLGPGAIARPGTHAEARSRQRISVKWAVLPLFLLDTVCIVFSMVGAFYLRFYVLGYYATVSSAFYTAVIAAAVPLWLVIFAVFRLYRADSLFGGVLEYSHVIKASTLGMMGLVTGAFLVRGFDVEISRGWLVMVWVSSTVSVIVARFAYRRVIYALRQRGLFVRRVLVVGANEEGRSVADQLLASPAAGVDVVGFVDPNAMPGTHIGDVPVLGALADLRGLVERLGVEEMIVIPTALEREALLGIYRDWGTQADVRVSLSSGLYELFTTGVEVREVGFVPLLSLSRMRIKGPDALVKALVDYVGALVGIVVLAPLFLVIAVLIRLDSEGSIIYRRRVVGLFGRRFDAFKFRTMIANADAYLDAHPEMKREWEETGKLRNDPRITRVGRFLRRYSLDELPQLFNVLRGEMSLVGPRMITPAEMAHFGRWQHNLLTVKPGLTGLWQVAGRSNLSYHERVRLDMHYIRNYTPLSDLRLLISTARAVLSGRGAC